MGLVSVSAVTSDIISRQISKMSVSKHIVASRGFCMMQHGPPWDVSGSGSLADISNFLAANTLLNSGHGSAIPTSAPPCVVCSVSCFYRAVIRVRVHIGCASLLNACGCVVLADPGLKCVTNRLMPAPLDFHLV